jgi:hypothetical protein
MSKPRDISVFKEVMNTQAMTWIKNSVFVLSFVFGVVAPYYRIEKEIALIKQSILTIEKNHLQHIQDLSQVQKEQQNDIKEMQKQLWAVIRD